LSRCTHCGELKMPHRVCPMCGYYKGKEILKVEA
jgi:large subunit ribosomal protein L32